ncbi:ATP-binding protein [Microbacterium sp. M3]|uniref:ATP-binding protein n=1 Tax=Microbacterium arthrosphaerae TaxID=792652 RepID=A0ABU4GYR3_9MICO|nr:MULTISPECIES: SbcC/MukB-like Walker B domain-containing protein [Microbacterium]MDW4572213.1 ATP-binding protein [Microbacterium arthrosphaerae]MDW7606068.1 ATP-binding protein [Microbacterium sp. M3]
MTMLDTLFGLIPAASRGQQWLAEDLQLVNWGGYDGAHRVRFSPAATLLCGGSGSGKSTLMDAYIALMMPHTTPFNGASNGGVTGRPRGDEQRNILSYGRGKIDESRTEDGTKMNVLRGDGVDTWTAVAMTWIDHDGSRFTAVRAWYIPASARVLEDTVRVRATVDDAFDLSTLAEAAALRLTDVAVRGLGLEPVGTDREFSARLHAVLGIGAAGAGSKAMSLLARIQAGQQITTVDDLYKRLVLEEPATMATADAVVAHFDGLESTRTRMLTARQQVGTLEPIRELRTKIAAAAERVQLIDEIGDFSDRSSLATLWRAERRLDLLREVETELQGRKQAADVLLREKRALADAAEAERDGLVDVLRLSGGDRLETAQRQLRDVERRLTAAQQNRAQLDDALRGLGIAVATREEFTGLVDQARAGLADANAKGAARHAFAEAAAAEKAISREIAELEAEVRRATGRRDNIPRALHESRELLASAAGLAPEDLPFVGELVEVQTEFEPWREAFNLALGGFATTLLIDTAHLSAFRAAIDGVRTPVRLRYEGVHTGLDAVGARDPRTLPGRLDYQRTPFTGWLQDRLDDRFAFVCVDSPRDLSQHRMALTITGQISQGGRGAHGGHGRENVLGFSNERQLQAIAGRLDEARSRLARAVVATNEAETALDAVDARLALYAKITDLTWEEVDVDAVTTERDRWLAVQDEVTTSNPEIARVQAQIVEAKAKAAALREEIARASVDREQIELRWSAVIDDVDADQVIVDDAEDAGRTLAPAQTAFLDTRFTLAPDVKTGSPSSDLARFTAALATAAQRLAEDRRSAVDAHGEYRESVRRIMVGFLDRWPNPNLLPDPDTAIGDFERILEALETSGLHELEAEWRDSLLKLSGNDLTNLDSTLSRSIREIRDRIEPINRIMQDLPFYDDDHRLQIATRENQSEARRRFRRELRDVRALIDGAATDDEREQVYRRMAKLIGHLRRSAPDFADLIDVRNHVRVSAERVDATTKQHVALYDHIGEKSGGESQELIAFIVGAALRYQLGDAGAERPRYAPVFMDEALIKADAHFTKRAIGAWRGLGFQLVIGAPNDKYSAIEPHVDVEYDILKDTRGRSWAKLKVGLPA